MSVTLLRVLQTIKGFLIVAVIAICTLLMAVGWKKVDVPNPATGVPGRGTSSGAGGSATTAAANQIRLQTQLIHEQPAIEYSCNLSNLAVLGKPLDNCATSEAVKLAKEEDIYVSVKTASKNHIARMLPVLLTWLQTLKPQQVMRCSRKWHYLKPLGHSKLSSCFPSSTPLPRHTGGRGIPLLQYHRPTRAFMFFRQAVMILNDTLKKVTQGQTVISHIKNGPW